MPDIGLNAAAYLIAPAVTGTGEISERKRGDIIADMSMIAARLERLPFSGFHRRLLLMGGLGYCFDAIDSAVIAFVLPVVIPQWSLTSVETGVLASATFIGYFFGAIAAGTLGDLIFGGLQP